MKKALLLLATAFLTGTLLLAKQSNSENDATQIPTSAKRGGGIVFLGDSITQGGKYLAAAVPSYRYQVFKNFVDNGIAFFPMGMTDAPARNVDISSLVPEYRGNAFKNFSEAAASGRTYQFSGHPASIDTGTFGVTKFKSDPKTVPNSANRGPANVKLGLVNPYTGKSNTFYDGATLTTYSGDTYKSRYGNAKPETLCVMIGINDIYDSATEQTFSSTAKWVQETVQTYQKYNPSIEVHVFKLLPTGKNNNTGAKNNYLYSRYNDYLDTLDISSKWSTKKSKVFLDDISEGFYAKDGSMCDTNGGAHPNAQGELILAGNIARALGIGQRNCGFREATAGIEKLESQIAFSAGEATISKRGQTNRKFSTTASAGTPEKWSNKSTGTLVINEKIAANNKAVSASWISSGAQEMKEFVTVFKIKMDKADATGTVTELTKNNRLSIFLGNGNDEVGILGIGENGIFWNNSTLLFGSTLDTYGSETLAKAAAQDPMTGYFTKEFHEFRIVYKNSKTDTGFYVWLDDRLIGEKLHGNTNPDVVSAYKNTILFGDTSTANTCFAEIAKAAFTVFTTPQKQNKPRQ